MTRTTHTYCSPSDVSNFLQQETGVGQNTTPSEETISQYIVQAEGEFERRTGEAYRPVYVQDAVSDVEAWRTRYRDLFFDVWWAIPRPYHMNHAPLLPFDSSRGHMIEVYEGNTDSNQEWEDWVTTKTQGRENDWWVDHEKGIVYIRKSYLSRRNALVRLTYEYGKPISTLNSNITSSDSTITLTAYHNRAATWKYSTRGVGRINDEWISWTGKTDTDLTGVTRGIFNTTAASHSSGDEVVEVPDDVRNLIIKYAAARLLENNRFVNNVGNSEASIDIETVTARWMREWDDALTREYARWEAL